MWGGGMEYTRISPVENGMHCCVHSGLLFTPRRCVAVL